MTRYALVIGIQKYGGSGFGDLKKPVEDAEAIAQILEAHGDFVEVTRLPSQWDVEKQGYQMVEADLKGVDLEKAIIGFFEKVGSNEALIYFSGHGAQVTKLGQKKGYLVTSDCTSENIASAGIALEDLNGLILNADFSSLVVLLDCCHSGSLLEKSQISSALSTFLSGKCNYFLATACRSHEKAYEGEDYSLFTAAVIKALKSPSADGRVRTAQLNQVIDEELRGSGQEPVVLKSGGEITLVTYPSTGKNESVCSDKLQNAIAKLRSDYEILDAAFFELVAAKVANKQARTQILKLRAANWSMLFQENYVERDQQGEALEKALQLSENDGISLMLIRGEPGAGKTALLRWLAYELFCQGKRVFHKKSQNQVVWLEQLREFSDESGGEHFYVIADDLFRDDSFLEELQQNEFLFPLTLIGTTRQNEDRHYDLEGLEYEVVCLDLAKPSAVEKGRILALPEVQTHLAGKSTAERQQLMDSPIMLVLMLQLSEGKPFDEVLRGIVKDLPSQDSKPIYQAFGVLCSFFQFGIIVPFEILHLCLPRSNWLEKMILSELEGIIDRRIYSGYEGLTTVHELIAKTVMELEYRPKDSGNHPYTSTRRPLIERYLKAIIPQLEPMNTTQKWWINHSFRKLVEKNAAPELAREIIQNHSQYIKLLQQWNTISEWVSWASIYEKLGCLEQQQVCISSILLTQPQSSSDWINWLTFVQRFGSRKQQQQAIIQTQSWLDSNLDNGEVRTRYMSLVAQLGSLEQQQQVIIQTQSWLENHTNDWYVRTKYLALVVQLGSQEQQQQAIIQTQSWLNAHPDDREVRRQYLALVAQLGSREQQQQAIIQTQSWLDMHPDNRDVRTQYLALVAQLGSREQQQQAIIQIQSWLDTHPDNCDVRTQYLALIGKTEKKSIATESLILNQWQWIMRQSKLDLSLWTCFLSVLYHHVSPNHELYNAAVNIVLKEYPDNPQIIGQVFGYFRDYLDYTTCRHLAMEISETNLPIDKWQNYVHAANFFRDYNDFDKAKAIYNRIISVKKKKIKQFPNLVKAIDFANLSYAKLLLLTNPTQPDEAIEKLNCILLQNPKHGYAHLLIAQSYQDKGIPFYSEAINHFEKAIQYDIKKDGFFYCLFGCFYRYAVGNIQQAKEHFEKSLNQKINLPACIELAELEATEGNLEQAKTLLESGLAIIPITRPQKEEREKLCDRIIALQTLLNLPMF
ncbi:MAG: caspase family protein [Pseudanabaena sp.]